VELRALLLALTGDAEVWAAFQQQLRERQYMALLTELITILLSIKASPLMSQISKVSRGDQCGPSRDHGHMLGIADAQLYPEREAHNEISGGRHVR
jgi:hypothetical protein